MRFFRINDSGVLEVTESLCAVPNRVVVYLDDVTPFMPPEATSRARSYILEIVPLNSNSFPYIPTALFL